MKNNEFDYMSEYKILWEGYFEPPEWATYGADDDPEYVAERGYEIKHNSHTFKVWEWTFIVAKQWKVEEYDPSESRWNYKGDYDTLTLALARVKELAEAE